MGFVAGFFDVLLVFVEVACRDRFVVEGSLRSDEVEVSVREEGPSCDLVFERTFDVTAVFDEEVVEVDGHGCL